MAHSQESWETAKAMFETGTSLTVIESTTGISKGQISKKSKKETWKKETLKDLASREVHTIIVQKEIEKEKETLTKVQRKHYDKLLLTEVQSMNLALNANHLLLEKIYDSIEDGTKDEKISVESGVQQIEPVRHNAADFNQFANAIQKTTDSLGITERHAPKTVIENTNAQQNNTEIVGYEVKTIEG